MKTFDPKLLESEIGPIEPSGNSELISSKFIFVNNNHHNNNNRNNNNKSKKLICVETN
jgi:hypothetical protein